MPDPDSRTSRDLANAVSEYRLWDVAQKLALQGDREALQVSNFCTQVFERTEVEAERLSQLAADLDADVMPERHGQRNRVIATAQNREDAMRFAARLSRTGYTSDRLLGGAASESFFRLHDAVDFINSEHPERSVHLEWARSKRSKLMPARLRPDVAEHQAVSLPNKLWPAYLAIRPLNAAKHTLLGANDVATDSSADTPTPSLVDSILETAGVSSTDHLVDINARSVSPLVERVVLRGGGVTRVDIAPLVHQPPQGANRKRRVKLPTRFERAGGKHREALLERARADLKDALSKADVVFISLSAHATSDAIEKVRALGFEGTLLSYGQEHDPFGPAPADSRVVLGAADLTVLRQWR